MNQAFTDYIAFWQEQPLETLRAIAYEHMGGYDPGATKEKMVACQSIILTTGTKRKAAQSLYEKNGFVQVGVKYVLEV